MNDFFTLTSFGTLSGAALVVVVVVSVIRHAFNWGPRWLGLIVSVLVAFAALLATAGTSDAGALANLRLMEYAMALLNGFLIYATAFGLQTTILAKHSTEPGLSFQSADTEATRLTFRTPW